ncbi:MAG: sensor histidine kinase [Propionibacteriaceae bacterium]|jgi:signal transduction histidine kinase|nr:sensor histidine kinase [Propionibacteriaceae bacterium]
MTRALPPPGLWTVRRTWDVLIAANVGVSAAFLVTIDRPLKWWPPLVAYALWYIVVGRRVLATPDKRGGAVYAAGLPVIILAGCWWQPWTAVLLMSALPLAWWLVLPRRRLAIAVTAAIAAADGLGQYIGQPAWQTGQVRWWFALGMPVVILAVTIVGGLFMERVIRWGEDRLSLVQALDTAQARSVALEREAAALEERARIAQDIHDTIAQDLAGMAMVAERVRRQADTLAEAAEPDARRRVADTLGDSVATLTAATRATLAETRALIAGTMPVTLTSTLPEALRRLADRYEREAGLVVTVTATEERLGREAQVVLLRCAQEGLANVRKHAAASHVTVTLTTRGDTATLAVADDGVGIGDAVAEGPGFGLEGLRDRVRLAGGELRLEPNGPGAPGCRLVVTVPILPTLADGPGGLRRDDLTGLDGPDGPDGHAVRHERDERAGHERDGGAA